MAYRDDIKADSSLWTNPLYCQFHDQLVLSTFNADFLLTAPLEDFFYAKNSEECPELIQYMPGRIGNDIESARKRISELLAGEKKQWSITFCVRFLENTKIGIRTIGYIQCLSPMYENGLTEWSMDFWINSSFRGQNIMPNALRIVLKHLQSHKIEVAEAIVGMDNVAARRVLEKCQMKPVGMGLGHFNSSQVRYSLNLKNDLQ